MQSLSDDVVEMKRIYDSASEGDVAPEDRACRIGMDYNSTNECTLEFIAPKDMTPPILIHYELDNFHQNHRSYSRNRDDFQLTGIERDDVFSDECKPLLKLGDIDLNPCGLIANTFFHDIFELEPGVSANGEPLVMKEEGIAWQSDIKHRFDFALGFKMEECPQDDCNEGASSTCCQDLDFSCDKPLISPKDGKCYAFHYPDEDTTQYLYETYPEKISPLEHVTNEHFIVWMRVATLPNFRKLYGYIQEPIAAGTVLRFNVKTRYVVESFDGYKALVISTNNIFGGQNEYLGTSFYGVGVFCLAMGLLFGLKHWLRPRKLANKKYLRYKEH
mmetsp:Transcript_2011/g.5573  ORF Transcript_2011/g.5573 Transcript_2011/m.5573 type:complete len:331 (+) Transcript_2011:395-1387(+)